MNEENNKISISGMIKNKDSKNKINDIKKDHPVKNTKHGISISSLKIKNNPDNKSEKTVEKSNIISINLSNEKSKINEIKKEENIVNKNKVEKIKLKNSSKEETQNIFNNYESDFSLKEESIIENFKNIKEHKNVNYKLVYLIGTMLIFSLFGFIILYPNNSIIQNYKISIFGVNQVKTEQIENTKTLSPMEILILKRKIVEKFLLENKNKQNKINKELDKRKKRKELKFKNILLKNNKK